MTKKKVWGWSCAVLMFLAICTVLSIRIETLMRTEVKTTRGMTRQGEEVREILLPATAVSGIESNNPFVQYVKKEKGIFGNPVWRVVDRPVIYLGEENGYAVVPEANLTEGVSVVDVIYYSTYPVEEGEPVTVTRTSAGQGGGLIYAPGAVTAEEVTPLFGRSIEGEYLDLSAHDRMLSQMGWLTFLVALIPAGGICLGVIRKRLCRLQKRDFHMGLSGILLFVGFLAALYVLTGKIEVPRQFLPEKQLFDIAHYVGGIQSFFGGMSEAWQRQPLYLELRERYKTAIVMCGALAGVAWIVTFGLAAWWKRKKTE